MKDNTRVFVIQKYFLLTEKCWHLAPVAIDSEGILGNVNCAISTLQPAPLSAQESGPTTSKPELTEWRGGAKWAGLSMKREGTLA